MSTTITTGDESGSNYIHIVNSRDNTKDRFVLSIGNAPPFGSYFMVWASSLESAMNEAMDYIDAHAMPNIFDNDTVDASYRDEYSFAYDAAIEGGAGSETATETATKEATDVAYADTWEHNGNFVISDNWNIQMENPTRDEILTFLGY